MEVNCQPFLTTLLLPNASRILSKLKVFRPTVFVWKMLETAVDLSKL